MLKNEVVKTLSKYKPIILKKKNDAIRKVIKTIQNKGNKITASAIQELTILNEK